MGHAYDYDANGNLIPTPGHGGGNYTKRPEPLIRVEVELSGSSSPIMATSFRTTVVESGERRSHLFLYEDVGLVAE
jgi:hypothetical protein